MILQIRELLKKCWETCLLILNRLLQLGVKSSMVEEVVDKIEKITMAMDEIIKVVEKIAIIIEVNVMEETKIKNKRKGKYICKRINLVAKDCYHRYERCIHHAHDPKDWRCKRRDDGHYVEKCERKAHYVEKDEKECDVYYSYMSTHKEHNDIWYVIITWPEMIIYPLVWSLELTK